MEDAIINTVLDYGALGIFAGFMVWQHITMQKRQREDQAASSERVDKLQTRFEEREEALRGVIFRLSSVIVIPSYVSLTGLTRYP